MVVSLIRSRPAGARLTETLGGDCDDGVEACHGTKVYGVERDLDDARQENGVYGHAARRHFAQRVGEWQALITRKGVY